ncbi:MAG TPA: tRNA pseudouridine(13) synthase TruD [Planctomycetaceae bacterium]|nr:tRNA pseudouridine(13) synthase TruD [Planctomycetaceae bacterium]
MTAEDSQTPLLATDGPLVTADLPGIGGKLKALPEDFVVEEIPAYEPSGDGEHLFLWIEKTGVAADELTRHLSRTLQTSPSELGTAGLKDKLAVTRQFVSVPRRAEPLLSAIETDHIRLLNATPHRHKLRTGHLRGNRFRVLVRDVADDDSLAKAQAIADQLRRTGLPNYFGRQRFGHNLTTLRLGLDLLRQTASSRERQRSNRRFLHRLALSAAQAWLFNQVLAERLQDGFLSRVFLGDVMQKCESGGLFEVRDVEAEQPRFDARETVLTGPMFGPKMRPTQHEPAAREQRILAAAGLTMGAFRRFGQLAEGTRRPMLIWLDDLQVRATAEGLLFEFSLPSGAYATVVLREFMKTDASESD